MFMNENYDATIDDNTLGKERLIFPDGTKVRWWAEAFGRSDDEMNIPRNQVTPPNLGSSTLTGVETAGASASLGSVEASPSALKEGAAVLASSLQSLSISSRSSPLARFKQPDDARQEMEVELQ